MAGERDAHTAEEQPVIDDIHPPHQAAHSWRDIFVHLATITVGLFIALSLEGCVEWQHHLFADQTTRVTSAYTNSFSVLYIFDVDEKAAKAVKNEDVTAAIQKVLAVQSELMVYDSIATELDRQYSETLQRQF